MSTATITGKQKIHAHFKRQEIPYWKLSIANDRRSIISSNYTDKDSENSFEIFREIFDNVDQNEVYCLDMYEEAMDAKKGARPSSSVTIKGAETKKEDKIKDHVSDDNKNFESAAFKKNIDLIQENAKLQVELSVYKRHNEELQIENKRLAQEVEELEAELEELEEEEEEESAMAGDPKNLLFESISGLIKSHGGALVESMTGLKGAKAAPKEEPEVVMNGTEDEIPDYDEIIERLEAKDENLQNHLYKLMLIAEQKPEMFKLLISNLDGIA